MHPISVSKEDLILNDVVTFAICVSESTFSGVVTS